MAYRVHRLDRRPALAGVPVEMPVDFLLALPPGVEPRGERFVFDPVQGIGQVLGRFGWERALEVVRPRVWAPGWSDDELVALTPFPDDAPRPDALRPDRLRAPDFPGTAARPEQHEVVHLVAVAETFELQPAELTAGLENASTRLLILQVPEPSQEAETLARAVVAGGGPPVAVVVEGDRDFLAGYFVDLVADLVHSRPISEIVRPRYEDEVGVDLFLGEDADDLLRFEPWLEALRAEADETAARVERSAAELERAAVVFRHYHHQSQRRVDPRRMAEALSRTRRLIGEAEATRGMLEEAAAQAPWHHESEGAIPVAESVERLEWVRREAEAAAGDLEAAIDDLMAAGPPDDWRPIGDDHLAGGRDSSSPAAPPSLRRQPAAPAARRTERAAVRLREHAEAEAERAPRTLNAGFRGAGARRPLRAGRQVFEVEVGPRRRNEDNRATGDVGFPERALPPRSGGHLLDVVLVSEELRPQVATGRLWLPRSGGRSSPVGAEGERGEPGPLRLAVEVPAEAAARAAAAGGLLRIGGRLAIYFENNLLQSAALRYWVAAPDAAGRRTPEENDVGVDFVLSGGFQEVEERFRFRRLRLPGDEAPRAHRPAVNIALNDDGAGGHRLLIKHGDGDAAGAGAAAAAPPPGWTPYDPDAARDVLRDARASLKQCFLADDGSIALDANNGKGKTAFLHDLVRLAHVGDRLRNLAFANVRGAPGQLQADWLDELLAGLAESRVIQVARTGPANYVFPWALVYDHPLLAPPGTAGLHLCKVTNEWEDDGSLRSAPHRRCPYAGERWHRENVYCPYGFWGLKHVVEQPPSPLVEDDGEWRVVDVAREVVTGRPPRVGVAVTDALDAAALGRRDRHLADLVAPGRLRLEPVRPAADNAAARAALAGADLVYFLCHGEYDEAGKEVYLGIGRRDDDPRHRVYPTQVQGWAQTRADPNLRRWRSGRPLVVVNGCHTADMEPGELLNFVSAFTFAGASGVVGTEVSVLVEVAAEVAEALFERLAAPDPVPVGQAIQEVRWQLAAKGNLIGLAYTPYCRADLRLAPARA